MTTTIPCPGCSTQLNLSDDICPVCMRTRSKQEIVRTYARLRQEEEQRQRRPIKIAAALLASGAAACVLYFSWPLLSLAFGGAYAQLVRFYDRITDPNYVRGASSDDVEPSPASPPPAPTAPPPQPARPAAPPAAPITRATAAPAPKASVAPPLPPGPDQWVLTGRVYDLLTLAPAPRAQFAAHAGTRTSASFASDNEGRYRVLLGRLPSGTPGYEIVSSDARYAVAVQYESDIPYARLPAKERRELARDAIAGDSHPTPLTDIVGEDVLRRDLFVCPRR